VTQEQTGSPKEPLDPKKPKTAHRKKARKMVLQALYQRVLSDAPISQIETEFRVDNDFTTVDGLFFSELLREIPKQLDTLDAAFSAFLDRRIDELDPIELCLLRMGTYELQHRIDVPYKVVINEAVDLAKQFGGTDGHKYINSVLDKVALRLRAAETRPGRSE
jgi:transcription antitermination protein NusB